MDEQLRNQIVQRHQAGASIRQIARELGITRRTVSRVLRCIEGERSGQTPASNLPAPSVRRGASRSWSMAL